MDDEATGDEPRILACLDHASEVVERGVGIRAANRLDERADDVVVLVAVPVVADGCGVDRLLKGRQVDGGPAFVQHRPRRGFECVERPAGIAPGHP